MKQKIDLYREVLEIEPNSKIFFPLARLLAEDGKAEQAVATLKAGLGRHPDHVEARLLLVELCFIHKKGEQVATEIQELGKMFKLYPNFWEAWSNELAQKVELQDAALALRFFAAALSGKDLSWAQIIAHGLRDVLGTNSIDLAHPFQTLPKVQSAKDKTNPRKELSTKTIADIAKAAVQESVPLDDNADEEQQDFNSDEKDEHLEEGFSIRTKYMADILAEQGDYAGALDIYQDLIETAQSDNIAQLEERAAELRNLMLIPSGSVAKEEKNNETLDGDKNRLVNLLESLAERLEVRSRSGV